ALTAVLPSCQRCSRATSHPSKNQQRSLRWHRRLRLAAGASAILLGGLKELAWLLPFDKRGARRKQRAEARKLRILSRHPRGSQLYLELLLCLPTAPALPLKETGTSVRRRFLGSSRTSHSLPVYCNWGRRT